MSFFDITCIFPILITLCHLQAEEYGRKSSDTEGKETDDSRSACGNQDQLMNSSIDSVITCGLLTTIPVTRQQSMDSSNSQTATPAEKLGSSDSITRISPRMFRGSDSSAGDATDSQIGSSLKETGSKKKLERRSATKTPNVDEDVVISTNTLL